MRRVCAAALLRVAGHCQRWSAFPEHGWRQAACVHSLTACPPDCARTRPALLPSDPPRRRQPRRNGKAGEHASLGAPSLVLMTREVRMARVFPPLPAWCAGLPAVSSA
jgi:hypothetical protein